MEKNKKASNWKTVKYFLPRILRAIRIKSFEKEIFFNINFPNDKIESIKGCKVVKAGYRKPGEILHFYKQTKNSFYFNMPSEREIHYTAKLNEDEYEMKNKFITISYHSYNNPVKKSFSKRLANSIGKIIE